MKKLLVVIALVMSVATLGHTANVTDTGPGQAGDVLYFTGQAGNDQGTWSNLPTLVQQVINNNITVPATVGSGVNGATPDTVGNLNFVGTGLQSTVSGSGSTATSNVDFSNLSTVEGQTNATNITNLTSTVNGNSTDISSLQTTVANHTTQINTLNTNVTNLSNQEATDVSGIQNMTDGSLLSNTVNNHTTQISNLQSGLATTNSNVAANTAGIAAINNMADPTTVLNQTVNGNTVAIANETTRATNAETTLSNGLSNEAATRASADTQLQNNINSEANTRASADQALQNQINNVNAQAQDNTNRIDRLEQTKYLLEPVVRLYDDKLWQVQAFDSYDVRHGMNSALGMRVMFKLGKSYEEKLLSKTNPEIARLLSANVSHDIAERDAIRKQLAEDRALIAEQSALLKQIQLSSNNVVLDAPVSSKVSSTKLLPKDEDLLQALDEKNEAFAAK